jgi:subtilisin family serine protease
MNRPNGPIFRVPPFTVHATYVALAETIDWGLAAYNVPQHWAETRGQGIRVAILDTGVVANHPDLAGAIDEVHDFTGSFWSTADRVGHGTHVSGIVGARRNDVGVVGVAPECRLLMAKVLGDDGAGDAQSVAAGIDWAVSAGADVLSMSFGSPQSSPEIEQAIARAIAQKRFVVCAAGNNGQPDSVDYPARSGATVAVGSVDQNGTVSSFSSRGDQVDVCAPGENILSTYLQNGYARLSGTSMATPFVTGVVALLLAKHRASGGGTPVDTQQQLVEHLRRTATDAGPQGKDPEYGYGLINPDSVLAAEEPAAPIPVPTQLRIGPIGVNGVAGVLVFEPQ